MRRIKNLFVSFGSTPRAACPRCAVVLRSATGLGDEEFIRPEPGALTLCSECETWLVFTDTLALRLARPGELARLSPAVRHFAEYCARRVGGRGSKRH